MRNVNILALLVLFFASGCSTPQYLLHVTTVPEGANLTWRENGQPLGRAPWIVAFPVNHQYMYNGCFHVSPITATWISGAKRHSENVIRLCGAPGQYYLSMDRPAGAPMLDADVNAAIVLMQQRLQNARIADQRAYEMWQEAAKTWGEALGNLAYLCARYESAC